MIQGFHTSITLKSKKPAADEFYWADLIGLGVVNREGLTLGTVVGLLDTGPHSVLRIQPAAAMGDKLIKMLVECAVVVAFQHQAGWVALVIGDNDPATEVE